MISIILSVFSIILFLYFSYSSILAVKEDRFKIASSLGIISIILLTLSIIFIPSSNQIWGEFVHPYLIEYIVGYIVFGVISIYFGWINFCKNTLIYKKQYDLEPHTSDFDSVMKLYDLPYRYPLNPNGRKAILVSYFLGYPIYILEYIVVTSWNIIKGIKNPFIPLGKIITKIFGPSLIKITSKIETKYK